MAKIEFKAKAQAVYNQDNTPVYRVVRVPHFQRSHCDMDAFRRHPKHGGLANSDLFPGILARIRRDVFGLKYTDHFRLDQVPDGVTVDETGFLVGVSVEV